MTTGLINLDTPLGRLVSKVIFGSSFGAGAAIAWLCMEAMKADPRQVIAIVGQWGAMPFILMAALYFGNERIGQGMKLMAENTAAQQKLADAVSAIAQKDNAAMQELTSLMSYVGMQQEKILEKLKLLEPGKTQSAAVGND